MRLVRTKPAVSSLALLREARELLGKALKFHIQSVTIGKLEHLEETGIISYEIMEARRFLEASDTLCAQIDSFSTSAPRPRA